MKHPKFFKAYLVLRDLTMADVARLVDMNIEVFRRKVNESKTFTTASKGEKPKVQSINHFTHEEEKKIVNALNMSESAQQKIFNEVLVPRKNKTKNDLFADLED